jgi:signal transduction histidine kinase
VVSTVPNANILIVDDDPRNLMALQELLQGPNQNLVLASSGEEALRHILRVDFAVILLDVRMPGIDGFTTARLIRERKRSRHTPIMFLTAVSEDVSSMFRGYQAGAVDYMIKPLIPEVLKSKVAVFVELHNKNAELARENAERTLVEEQLRESQDMLRALAGHLQSVREEEQTRIAREIHDELGQALTGLKMDLSWMASKLPAGQKPLLKKSTSMSLLIDHTIQAVRRIASGLRPEVLDEVGLTAAIAWQAREFQKRTGIRCKAALPTNGLALGPERSTAVFRIFQEVLTNVARHANATRVDILMQLDTETLVLHVEDNGKGISEASIHSPKSLGLLGMRERVLPFGGAIEVMGRSGNGTKVAVSVPLS